MSEIRYRKSDHKFLDPDLPVEFRNFLLKLAGACLIGLILAPVIYAWAGGQ